MMMMFGMKKKSKFLWGLWFSNNGSLLNFHAWTEAWELIFNVEKIIKWDVWKSGIQFSSDAAEMGKHKEFVNAVWFDHFCQDGR